MRGNCTALMSFSQNPSDTVRDRDLCWHLHIAVQILGQYPHELQSRKTGPL